MLEPHLHTLAALIAAQPDRTLAELKDALATPASVPTVWRAVRALGLTVKKTVRPAEHDRPDVAAARVAWHAAAPTWDVAHLVFLDETGITTNLLRRYGRAPRGARVHDHAPCGRRQTSTFLAALRVTGLTAPGVFGRRNRWRELPRLHRTDPGADSAARRHRHWLTTSGPTRSPASGGLSRPPGPPSGTCHPIARTSIPSSSASRSSRPSFAPHAVAAVRRSGRSLVPVSSASALTNAATIFGTAGTQPPHGHEKRSKSSRIGDQHHGNRLRLSRTLHVA